MNIKLALAASIAAISLFAISGSAALAGGYSAPTKHYVVADYDYEEEYVEEVEYAYEEEDEYEEVEYAEEEVYEDEECIEEEEYADYEEEEDYDDSYSKKSKKSYQTAHYSY